MLCYFLLLLLLSSTWFQGALKKRSVYFLFQIQSFFCILHFFALYLRFYICLNIYILYLRILLCFSFFLTFFLSISLFPSLSLLVSCIFRNPYRDLWSSSVSLSFSLQRLLPFLLYISIGYWNLEFVGFFCSVRLDMLITFSWIIFLLLVFYFCFVIVVVVESHMVHKSFVWKVNLSAQHLKMK